MKEHIFEPSISFNNKIEAVNDLLMDHDFNYEYSSSGVKITGNIALSFTIKDAFTTFQSSLNYPIDLFIALNEIDSLKEITLEIDDLSYEINDNVLKFKIVTKLKGDKEDFVFFELSPNERINKEAISLLMRKIKSESNKMNISESKLKKFEELIKTSSVDLISSSSDDIECNEDIIEFLALDDSANDLLNENEKEDIIDAYVNEEKVKDDVDVRNNNVINDDNNQNKEIKKEELFKDNYVSTYFFYVLKDNEVKENIIEKFKISEELLDKYNKDIIYKKGNVIRIPK